MKNQTVQKLIAVTLIAAAGAIATLATLPAKAADQKPADQKPALGGKKDERAAASVPFHGKLDSVDKTARSIKVGDRSFQVIATTKITKDGSKPGTLDDAKVGEAVGGAYREADGGKFELVSLRVGPKPDKKAAADKKK